MLQPPLYTKLCVRINLIFQLVKEKFNVFLDNSYKLQGIDTDRRLSLNATRVLWRNTIPHCLHVVPVNTINGVKPRSKYQHVLSNIIARRFEDKLIHGSHFSGLTKFPDFSLTFSVIYSFFPAFFKMFCLSNQKFDLC